MYTHADANKTIGDLRMTARRAAADRARLVRSATDGTSRRRLSFGFSGIARRARRIRLAA